MLACQVVLGRRPSAPNRCTNVPACLSHSIEPTFVSGRKSHVFILRRPTPDFQVAETTSPAAVFDRVLEGRILLSAFTVLNLNDQGAGSLRQAILNADSTRGADVINFDVAGTITLAMLCPLSPAT